MDDPEMVEKLTAVMVAVEAYTVEIFAVDAFSNAVKRVLVLIVDPDTDDT
jgi:hypothetical protein